MLFKRQHLELETPVGVWTNVRVIFHMTSTNTLEDIREVIRNRKSRKDRQYNDQKKNDNRTNNETSSNSNLYFFLKNAD
jgi:hypothetical protein